jgi:alginate O-acetyltransferase complex protein AlgI
MLFSSIGFLFFFVAVLTSYAALSRSWTARKILLLVASYGFYMVWNPPFVLLLMGSTLLDYMAGKRIAASRDRRVKNAWLVASCIGNLGVLGFFKFGDFLVSNVWYLAQPAVQYPELLRDVVLPVGISFYTFQSLSYTIDVYRDRRSVASGPLDFALYVSFFPQLVAGPILRARDFLPQLSENKPLRAGNARVGIDQVARGFAKKLLIADALAPYVDTVFASPASFGAVNILLALYAYSFQIYCDFSGYSDIAIGTARILGFRVPDNFQLPFLARNPREHWQRWHMSLSSWLRDYLYIPLGGSRLSPPRTYVNLLLTMTLGGLWHGAAWNFVLWGLYHGVWLCAHRLVSGAAPPAAVAAGGRASRLWHWISVGLMFHVVCGSWVLFRAQSLTDSGHLVSGLLDFAAPFYHVDPMVLLLIGIGFGSHILGSAKGLARSWDETGWLTRGLWYAFLTLLIFLRSSRSEAFIYFQF